MALAGLQPVELSICRGASSFLQTDFWGSFKARFGWKPYSFNAQYTAQSANQEDNTILPLLVLYRHLGFGIGFAYVPLGPELPADYDTENCQKAAQELAVALQSLLPKDTAFIRFDFPWLLNKFDSESLLTSGFFKRAAADVQPPDSVLVDLVPDEKAMLGSMKSKWRYNIGLAEKKGIKIRCVAAGDISTEQGTEALAAYYKIYRETALRDGISIHGLEYYRVLFEEADKYGVDLRLYMASHEDEDIAGIVTLFRGREAVYLYGASSSHKRNLMAPYALQWKAMQDAKAFGCRWYDLYGIPPKPPEEEPNHPMAGLYRFKTGFISDEGKGGSIIRRLGSWDYSCRPLAYALYSTAEKTRKKIWDIKKRLKKR